MIKLEDIYLLGEITGHGVSPVAVRSVFEDIRMTRYVVEKAFWKKKGSSAIIDGVEFPMRFEINSQLLNSIDNTMCDVFIGRTEDDNGKEGYELLSTIPSEVNMYNMKNYNIYSKKVCDDDEK